MSEPAIDPALAAAAEGLARIEGLLALPCDGDGHPIEGASACLHLRCTIPSPGREELLAQVGPLVRRAGFVLAALIDRRDLYSLSFKAARQGAAGASEKLRALLADEQALASRDVADRRGR